MFFTARVNRLQEKLAAYAPLEAQVESLFRQVDNIFNELDQIQGTSHASKPKTNIIKMSPQPPPLALIEGRKASMSLPRKKTLEQMNWDVIKPAASSIKMDPQSPPPALLGTRKGSMTLSMKEPLEQERWDMNKMLLAHMDLNEVDEFM